MPLKQILSVAATALVCWGAQAQTLAPGLWEHTIKMKSADGRFEAEMAKMQQKLATMPPERRKQMEAAMGKTGMMMSPDGVTVKVCVTKEEAARPVEQHLRDVHGQCTNKDLQRSGNTWTFKFECPAPPSSGTGQMTYISDKAYSGKSVVTSTRAGKAQQTTVESSGKWLTSDCGDVKPLDTAAPR